MTTLLVANRGEIALRVFRTARRMGMRCVAVYSDADEGAPFTRAADVAVRIGPPAATESYLNIEAIIAAAAEAGATLVHPGYGFLAEDSSFAEACEKAGLVFVGPPPAVLEAMGSKDVAKDIARSAGVPVLQGYAGDDQSDDAFKRAAEEIGYPVIVKPVAGGGGKGMSVAHTPFQLERALGAARRAGAAAFGDDRLLIERYLLHPRHIEVQIMADSQGNVIHLGERDCSLQRRHQKILEETPAPNLDPKVRDVLLTSAVSLAHAAGYRSAGTCEFLVGEDGTVAFLEMNARLQVEHPVTEVVTGIDLVEVQLRVAQGHELGIAQEDVSFKGNAIEVRIYAEDPEQGFIPQTGTIEHVAWPAGTDVRIDSGIEEGSRISPYYDPMIAKLIVGAASRAEAVDRLADSLLHTEILGIRNNLPFLLSVLDLSEVRGGTITTDLLSERGEIQTPENSIPDEVIPLAAAAAAEEIRRSRTTSDPWSKATSWRLGGAAPLKLVVVTGSEESVVEVHGDGPYRIGSSVVGRVDGTCHGWDLNGVSASVTINGSNGFVWFDGSQYEVGIGALSRAGDRAAASHLDAPMPGQVLAVRVGAGDKVTKGQELIVVEAMKMEHSIKAPADGIVKAVLCAVGERVLKGKTLVDFESS